MELERVKEVFQIPLSGGSDSGGTKAFHYTNERSLHDIIQGGSRGAGLQPHRRFVRSDRGDLPDKAYQGVSEALLEPGPDSWKHNPEFPTQWRDLFHDVCRGDYTILVSFDIQRGDDAYVVDRAPMSRELYREAHGLGPSTERTMNAAIRRYWESRTRPWKYEGKNGVPQLTIWSPIETERLQVEEVYDTSQLWQNILDTTQQQLEQWGYREHS